MATVTVKQAVTPGEERAKQLLKWFVRLNILGVLITAYLIHLHYKPSSGTICQINEYWDCDKVNQSTYSLFLGVPVAIWGALTYAALAFTARKIVKKRAHTKWPAWLSPTNLIWAMFLLVTFGVVFSLRLTYIELYVLEAICIFCLAQQVVILVDFGLMVAILKNLYGGKSSSA